MCWEGKISGKRIAQKDITVYKVLERWGIKNKEYQSPFQRSDYKIGHKYSIDEFDDRIFEGKVYINQGLHCYSQNVYVNIGHTNLPFFVIGNKSTNKIITVSSSRKSGPLMQTYNLYTIRASKSVVVKCVIPKGTTYYINKNGEIVTKCLYIEHELGSPTNYQPMRLKEVEKNNLFNN